ncbi:hypothetical protein V8F44DRAFT_606455 [Aspergillus fumigatus]
MTGEMGEETPTNAVEGRSPNPGLSSLQNRQPLEDRLAIIEVLQGHHSIYNEMWHENNRRR